MYDCVSYISIISLKECKRLDIIVRSELLIRNKNNSQQVKILMTIKYEKIKYEIFLFLASFRIL